MRKPDVFYKKSDLAKFATVLFLGAISANTASLSEAYTTPHALDGTTFDCRTTTPRTIQGQGICKTYFSDIAPKTP